MPLVNDLLEDLDKVLWYCSLDMASGFWVVEMTERARMVSAFITPFGLFEWLGMPFGLKNAPQIYQRLLAMHCAIISGFQKPNELNYGMVEKEILALVRILDVCYSTLVTRPIKVLTLHSTLAWLMRSTELQGRLGNWAALLSPGTLEIVKCTRGEDEILGTIITPRENVDSILSSIAPRKQPRQQIPAVIPTVEQGEELLVVSFDGSARVKRGGGACSAIVWKLPEWIVVTAESKYLPGLTVNEARYQGLLLGFDLLSSLNRGRLIICGNSNLVIRQMRGEIECKVPGLTPLRRRVLDRLRTWPVHEFLHVKGD
ncbi:hypothetical protein L917_21600 [Phytophthora nicotianae]|uniref:Uncharacterized protein n=1 Tax=Phytophthora nicotianae TaxID=4792 RepID=W2JX57_PHYNI|nr:hypothetical protein L917_21600 [Phytophthora nicotianae]